MFNKKTSIISILGILFSTVLWLACSGPGVVTIGGKVTGLNGTLVIVNNTDGQVDKLVIKKDGEFTFGAPIFEARNYEVTVEKQPDEQVCTVVRGVGEAKKDITTVEITCSAIDEAKTVGGSVSGLTGTVVLQLNDDNDLTISADGDFVFDAEIAKDSDYEVTVLTQPVGQTCAVTNGTGTIDTSDITDVSVTCSTDTYVIGGTVSGLVGTVVLQNNAGNNNSISSNGAFTFTTEIAHGATYAVTVLTHPATKYCVITNAGGTATGTVTNVTVTCMDKKLTFISDGTNGDIDAGGGAAAGADALCMASTNYPGIGTYKAMIATSTRHACTTANCGVGGVTENLDWVLPASMALMRVDGSTFIAATTAAKIIVFPMTNPWELAVGTNQAARIWSGFNSNWTTHGSRCTDWSVTTGSGAHGRRDAIDIEAIQYNTQNCVDTNVLLCVEQ